MLNPSSAADLHCDPQVVSPYICNGTHQAINGGFFETLCTLISVVLIWVFWSSITEDDWPAAPASGSTYT